MKRIGILGAGLAAGLMGSMAALGPAVALEPAPTVRQPTSQKKREGGSPKRRIGRSKYMPHAGKKELERAKRCYMETHFKPVEAPDKHGFQTCHPRSAPVMQQMSKTDYEAYLEAREQEYESVF